MRSYMDRFSMDQQRVVDQHPIWAEFFRSKESGWRILQKPEGCLNQRFNDIENNCRIMGNDGVSPCFFYARQGGLEGFREKAMERQNPHRLVGGIFF